MKRGQKFKTQDGRWAYFIAKEPKLRRPLIFRVGQEVWTRRTDGRHCDTCNGAVYPAILLKREKP